MGFLAAPPRAEVAGAQLPYGWDAGWRAARGRAASTPARVVFVGDSITSGQPANQAAGNTQDWLNQGYYGVLRDRLAQRMGGLGAEFFGTNESVLRNQYYHDGSGATPRAPLLFANGALVGPSGSTPANYGFSIVQNGWWYVGQSASTGAWTSDTSYMAAFTSPYADTVKVDALYVNYFGHATLASFKYGPNADGSGATTVSGFPINFNAVQRTTVYSGAPSKPTVYFGSQAHASDFYLLGCIAYRDPSAGLQVGRHAYTGNTSVQFTQANIGQPSDRAKAVAGGHDGTQWDAIGFPTCPHLLVYALGVNDCNRSRPDDTGVNADPHTFMWSIRRVVEAGRRGRPDMSILLLLPHYPPIDYADNPSFAYNDSWVDYHQAAQVVAQEYGCALLSMNQRWGATAAARGFQAPNDGHPTAAGYADMAAFLAEVL